MFSEIHVRMNPVMDENKKEEKRRPGFSCYSVKILRGNLEHLGKNLSFRLTMRDF